MANSTRCTKSGHWPGYREDFEGTAGHRGKRRSGEAWGSGVGQQGHKEVGIKKARGGGSTSDRNEGCGGRCDSATGEAEKSSSCESAPS